MATSLNQEQFDIPIQPVERPIICSPYQEPTEHWVYNTETGEAQRLLGRRPASYWYKRQRIASQQLVLSTFAEEEREDLSYVNALRKDVKRWRLSGYEGATQITKELLQFWWRADRLRRFFFCQLEAVETVIFLSEIQLSGKKPRFKPEFTEADLAILQDWPATSGMKPLTRLGLKMATGTGKTVVMAMLVAWAFCNRGKVPSDERFPSAVLVVCPNLTIKERLQVLRPDNPDNYYVTFDIVPITMRPLLQLGKVLVTNWHLFYPESEHVEGQNSYMVVNKGPESEQAFAQRVLGDLYERSPLMVFNDEAHHAWRPKYSQEKSSLSKEEEEEFERATHWVGGLDTFNNVKGLRFCLDLSATPFYLYGSGYVEGSPFPWLVGDFGLVDAIESGIVKIPRLPVSDTTGRPEPAYFRLWQHVIRNLQPGDRLPGKSRRPDPEAVYRHAEPALNTLAGQWVERFRYIQVANNSEDKTPPVLIIVCDNTDIAEVLYRYISGEQILDNKDEVAEYAEEDEEVEEDGVVGQKLRTRHPNKSKTKARVKYGRGRIFADYFSNQEGFTPTIRIDSKLLAQAEQGNTTMNRQEAAEYLRRIVSTVGKRGEPGEQVRCVISVAMLNEGWDANNVTHILGLRSFSSQLLCEQVVGRGLRRMDYTPDPQTGLLTEEYVDIYGVPFSLIPFRGRYTKASAPEDRPKSYVRALPERANYEMKFPVVEGYVFALRHNVITANIDQMEVLALEPENEPKATYLKPRVGYQVGGFPNLAGPGEYVEQNRKAYYDSTHLQTIEFEIARLIVNALVGAEEQFQDQRSRSVINLHSQSRHQLFPQVLRLVKRYVERKVEPRGMDMRELGQQKYVKLVVERLLLTIRPDDAQGEPPLMPILNRYKPLGSTAEVSFKTTRICQNIQRSHINLMVSDTVTWENAAAVTLDHSPYVSYFARNDGLGFTIPYDYDGENLRYEPDFLVRLRNGKTLILEIHGWVTNKDQAKYDAAKRWIRAVNNWSKEENKWQFHLNRDPYLLDSELSELDT